MEIVKVTAETIHSSSPQNVRNSLLIVGQRILVTGAHLLFLIFLVSLTIQLSRGGGIQSFNIAFPAAVETTTNFITDLFNGDLPVWDEMQQVFPRSMGLLLISLSIGTLIGLTLGGIAAVRKGSRISTFLMTVSVIGVSTPTYVVAMFLIWGVVWFFQTTDVRILPVYGFGWDLHLIMPVLVLSARPLASMLRLSYASFFDIFRSDFVRTAHSKGLRPRTVFWRHVVRNAGVPLLTTAGVSFRFGLAVLPIVEFIFTWPGIGLALLESIQSGDINRVLVMILPLATLFILVNILLDFLYPLIDPRLRKVVE
jgi:peptide/nickel transport system permease protein